MLYYSKKERCDDVNQNMTVTVRVFGFDWKKMVASDYGTINERNIIKKKKDREGNGFVVKDMKMMQGGLRERGTGKWKER